MRPSVHASVFVRSFEGSTEASATQGVTKSHQLFQQISKQVSAIRSWLPITLTHSQLTTGTLQQVYEKLLWWMRVVRSHWIDIVNADH